MTDAEIIKALECCYTPGMSCERDCPFHIIDDCNDVLMAKYVIDLINRQKAEIDILIRKKETLQDEIAELQAEIDRLQKQENTVAKLYYMKGARDFAKRVREDFYLTVPAEEIVNKILKDLVGETKKWREKRLN